MLSAKALEPKVSLVGGGAHCPRVAQMAGAASEALATGVVPELVDDGLGGTYFISARRPGAASHAASTKISVFKPRDEEPNAINNPKQQTSGTQALGAPGLKGGIRVGDAALNEWAGEKTPGPPPYHGAPSPAIALTLRPPTAPPP